MAALVVVPLVMKVLSKGDAGLWFCFQNMLGLINLTDFGLSYVVARQVSYTLHARPGEARLSSDFIPTREGWSGVSDIYHASCALFRGVGLVALVLLVFLYHLVLPLGKLLTHADPQTGIAWYLLGASTLLSLQAKPHLALVEGLAKLYLTRFLAGTTQLLTGIGVILALLLGGHLVAMASVVCALSLLQYLAARYLVSAVAGKQLEMRKELPAGFSRKFFRVAIPMGILNLSSFLVSSVQVPLLGFFLGPQVVPGFFIAQRIGQMLNQGVMQFVSPQMPLFTREIAREDWPAAGARLRKTIVLVTTLAMLANLVLCFGSPLLVELWVGPGRYIAPLTLTVLSIDYFLMSSSVVWAQFVLAGGSNPFVWSTLLSGVLNLLLLWLLVPPLATSGAALAGLIAGLLINYWYVVYRGILCLRRLQLAPCTH